MKRKSFNKSRKRDRDDGAREKKIRDPRKHKSDKDFSVYDELEEIDSQDLLDDHNEFDEMEDDVN
jgi:hypothetical protein